MELGAAGFEDCLFINCPFDEDYVPLLHCLLFVVLECGLRPRLSLEEVDSGTVRIEKIRDLIRSCRYSIHDISRMEALKPGDEPRFNMPFELGLDLGCRYYGGSRCRSKRCLILERDRYRYQRVLSDLAGNDIRAHESSPKRLMAEVRDWLRVVTEKALPSRFALWERFNSFQAYLKGVSKALGDSEGDGRSLEVVEYIGFIRDWRARNPGAN